MTKAKKLSRTFGTLIEMKWRGRGKNIRDWSSPRRRGLGEELWLPMG